MMRNNNKLFPPFLILILCAGLFVTSCKNDDEPGGDAEKTLIIENGARSMNPDESFIYSASFVDVNGNVTAATNVTWSSDNSATVTISGNGAVTASGVGTTNITATVEEDGVSFTASVPLSVQVPNVFTVVPSAIIYEVGGSIQLEWASLSTSQPTLSYSSDNSSVASVSNSGLVTFNGVGNCVISVTASTHPNNPFLIPVLVVGAPSIPLPVTRVEIDPNSSFLFRGETVALSAQAYNLEGATTASFTWSSSAPDIASVDQNGTVTAHSIGDAVIYASAQGITGQAEVYVSPDTIVEVTPFLTSIGAGGSRQFSARAYNVRTNTYLNGITNFDWTIPTYGFSIFDFASVNNSGLVSVNSNAIPGNTTFVIASLPGQPDILGVGTIIVSLCDCGPGNADVSTIDVTNGPFSLSLFSNPTATINAVARDAQGNVVNNPELKYCVDDMTVVQVDEITGELIAFGEGTTNVTVCSGSFAETTVAVTVSF